ncbi:ferredoxin [Konateibacter massiliensis]|uniref:ferredoxin n=1 Tax=Konateibacter massiliensis TaxID=2002841 RepID=UPI000C156199|nr:ferredoxin [Konateibacter massiliensis]
MRAFVDQDMCIGCGMCVGVEPDVFRMNDEDKAEGYADTTDATRETVAEAIDMCPVGAISESEE